ncbi:MAG: sugar kinase [Actinobacteria bacterium 13_2_20CM_2_72_6]|nr:MAG: sugar kinase [Actinobacteria bacterium 13_2_20CM_2_72_6]
MSTVIAIDVGGTGIKAGLVDDTGTLRHIERHPTGAARGGEAVIETILGIATGLATRADGAAKAVGIVVPGVVDERNGVATWAANIGFRDVPLRDLLTRHLGLPAALGHDVRAGGTAEARLGAGRGYQHMIFLAIGTGIAGAHVVHGVSYAGAHGAAGEVGHLIVRPGGPKCGCGALGCLETVASAAAIGRTYAERTGRTATAADVAARAVAGEPAAQAVWADAVDALADGLHATVTLNDPEVVVVGGGLAEAGDALLVPLDAALAGKLTFQRRPALVRAALGDEASCLGAGLLALSLVDGTR